MSIRTSGLVTCVLLAASVGAAAGTDRGQMSFRCNKVRLPQSSEAASEVNVTVDPAARTVTLEGKEPVHYTVDMDENRPISPTASTIRFKTGAIRGALYMYQRYPPQLLLMDESKALELEQFNCVRSSARK